MQKIKKKKLIIHSSEEFEKIYLPKLIKSRIAKDNNFGSETTNKVISKIVRKQ